ncbi:MAG: YidC/Oxa1 family membrane protein insertase [Bacilli bacterium]|nr:YidC/Oxa1 family membrane protein insertase [Bacilli bacterium]
MKKNKYIKILILLMLVLTLTGCTKYGKDNNKKAIVNEKTGQRLVTNILCKPTDKDMIELYDSYNKSSKKKVDLEKLDNCKNMKIQGEYQDLWTNIFVKPLAWFIIKIGNFLKSYGLALIIATLIIRLIAYPFTKKAAMQSENMKKASPALEKLERKYQNKTDQESMMKKSQEMMIIYKQNNINPMSTCLFTFFQIPLFFAFYEAISRIPIIFEEKFLGFELGTSPINAVTMGDYKYLIFIVLIGAATYFSFKLNSGSAMNKEQEKQMKMMSNVMVIVMTITAFSISTGIAFYWITTNVFTIIQNLLVKRGKNKNENN